MIVVDLFRISKIEFFEQREAINNEKEIINAMESCKVVTSERGQSCNVLAESSQTIYGKDPLVGEIERCEVQRKARDLKEKPFEVTVVTR